MLVDEHSGRVFRRKDSYWNALPFKSRVGGVSFSVYFGSRLLLIFLKFLAAGISFGCFLKRNFRLALKVHVRLLAERNKRMLKSFEGGFVESSRGLLTSN